MVGPCCVLRHKSSHEGPAGFCGLKFLLSEVVPKSERVGGRGEERKASKKVNKQERKEGKKECGR
ncbi:hypothetical protein E2C01_092030 [Portunus trituberculatus]|uniref:Uncharacterized protein n=1 Tax=Portunus trituberculatus TaxID=210409 RepID=A0A5B7JWN9_PORTR|nr:hypothetical protein [Portunus trituberculatus]